MSPSPNAIETVLNFWTAAKDVGTSEAWYECFVQMDALFVFHCHPQANIADHEYFHQMRMAALEMMEDV